MVKVRILNFERGELVSDETQPTQDENGTFIFFEPDNTESLFKNYQFHDDYVETMLPQLPLRTKASPSCITVAASSAETD